MMLRAIPMLRLLGFRRMHVFGFDSSLAHVHDVIPTSENVTLIHHAYLQPENDSTQVISVVVNGGDGAKRVFKCHPWMLSQANEFMDLIKMLGNEIELEIYGDGLIGWILKTAADKADGSLPDVFEIP